MAIKPTNPHPPVDRHRRRPWLARPLAAALMVAGTLTTVGSQPAAAEVTEVAGSAFGYYTDVSLFGGPSMLRGFGQPADAPDSAASPSVELPDTGGDETDTDPDGAAGVYGPATIFGGIWPESAPSSPPSGPIAVAAEGTTGATGSVTSSVDIVLHDPPDPDAPGGIGPGPVIAEEVHSECTADDSGDPTASVSFVNGTLETKYDENTQLPIEDEPIPDNPEPNYERSGTIDHVGDSYTVIFNEQIDNDDGSLTVNAVHMILEGPTAVGDMVIGSSTCGVNATAGGGDDDDDDGDGDSDNEAPVAVDDPDPDSDAAYNADFETPLTVSADTGVLRNDTDPDGDDLTAGSASEPGDGTVELEDDGSFVYTPDDGFSGRDTFTYAVSDGQGASSKATAQGTVKIDVASAGGGGGGDDDDEADEDGGMTLELSASPASRPAPGGAFTFDVLITNTSDGTLNVTKLTDDVYGDLNGQGTCVAPQNLLAGPATGNTYSCSYTGEFSGDAGETRTSKVTATAGALTASDEATVAISGQPAGAVSPNSNTPGNNESARGAGTLARTGGEFTRQVQLAVGLTGVGVAMVLSGNRRRRQLAQRRPTQLTRLW